MDRAAFDLYVETRLGPALQPGTVVILDNLSIHRSPKAAEILHVHGCWFRSREKPSTERLSDPLEPTRLLA